MKHAAGIFFAVALSAACAQKQVVPFDLPGIPREVDPSIAIFAENGQTGHACAVDGKIYSAGHVFWNKEEKRWMGATWSSRGQDGYARVAAISPFKDIVQIETAGGSIVYLPSGEARVGEYIYWFEYDFRTKENALRGRRRFAKVLRIVAQQYVLDESPVGGASGTCLISERGEAVGVVAGGWRTDDKALVGIALTLPKEYR